jgi:hypothetical protein
MLASVTLSIFVMPGIVFMVYVFINLCKESRKKHR